MNPLCRYCFLSSCGSIPLNPDNSSGSSSTSSANSSSAVSGSTCPNGQAVTVSRIVSGSGNSTRAAVRMVCMAGEHREICHSASSRGISVGFLGSRGRSHFTVASEGYALSDMLGGLPVTAICEGTPRVCCLLSPVSRDHPVVRALLETWCRFFRNCPRGRYLQVYTGSSGTFIEVAYSLFQRSYPCLVRRIRIVGVGVSSFVPSAANAHYYRVTFDWFTYLSFADFYRENARGRVVTVPYSTDLTSAVPTGLDPSYNVALRSELMRLVGFAPLREACVSYSAGRIGRHEILYVCVVDPEYDDLGDRSGVFQWISSLLRMPRTGVEAGDNDPPSSVHGRMFTCLMQAARAVTFVCMVGTRNLMRAGWNEVPLIFCASCYLVNGVGCLVLWATNSMTRRHRWRYARILCRFCSDLARLSMGIEFEEAMRFGFMDLHTQMTTGGINPCSLFNSIWSMTLLTELMIVDLLPHYGGNIYGALQRFFIRCASPGLYSRVMQAISDRGRDLERGNGTSGNCTFGEASRCLTSTSEQLVITRQENIAIRTASSLFGLIFGSIGLCIGFWGVDLSAVRFFPGCRQNCTSQEGGDATNCTTLPIYPYASSNYTYTNVAGLLNEGSVYTTARTVRLVFQTVFFFYYLFILAQTVLHSRRRR